MDGQLGIGGGNSPALELPGPGRYDLGALVAAAHGASGEEWLEQGIGSVILAGGPHCALSLYEREDMSGWRAQLQPGRYTMCALYAHGVPAWEFPRLAHLSVRRGSPSEVGGAVSVDIPRFAHRWHGAGRLARLSTFQHFELTFAVSSTPRGGCGAEPDAAAVVPLLEFSTTGITSMGTFCNASHPACLEQARRFFPDASAEDVDLTLRKAILLILLHRARSRNRVRLIAVTELGDFPNADPFECKSVRDVHLSAAPLVVTVSVAHSNVLRLSVGGEVVATCPLRSATSMHQHVDVFLGSRALPLPSPRCVTVSGFSYRALGPLGVFRPPSSIASPTSSPCGRVPRVIHQVWLGSTEPRMLTDTWRAYVLFAPGRGGWEYRLWRSEEELDDALWRRDDELLRQVKSAYDEEPTAAGKSDFLRWALLYVFGGVYVDADALWLGPPSSFEPLLYDLVDSIVCGPAFVAAWETPAQALVATGVVASAPGALVARQMLEAQVQLYWHCRRGLRARPWDPLALGSLTNILTAAYADDPAVWVAPSAVFYPIGHQFNPWRQRGVELPSLREEVPQSVSVDIGLGSNGLEVQSFAALESLAITGNCTRSKLLRGWRIATQTSMEALRLQRALKLDDASYLDAFKTLVATTDGDRLEWYPQGIAPLPAEGVATHLLIVAHSDDECIFASHLLFNKVDPARWMVVLVFVPTDPAELVTRLQEFHATLHLSRTVSEALVLGYPETSKPKVNHPELYDDLERILHERSWLRVVTHGPFGEYGHPQHRELFLGVSALVSAMSPPLPLWVFQPSIATDVSDGGARSWIFDVHQSQRHVAHLSGWSPDARPLGEFDVEKARAVCIAGSRLTEAYERTCLTAAFWPQPGRGFLSWEAHAEGLRSLALELARTADVGLYGYAILRRHLFGLSLEALMPSSKGSASGSECACTIGSASAMMWAALTSDICLMALPAPPGSRLLQDITGSRWPDIRMSALSEDAASAPSAQSSGPRARFTSEGLADCGVVLGPVAAVVSLLSREDSRRLRRRWRIAVHGDMEEDVKTLEVDSSLTPSEGVSRALVAALSMKLASLGWRVARKSASCLVAGGYERDWKWISDGMYDFPTTLVRPAERYGCWMEVDAVPA